MTTGVAEDLFQRAIEQALAEIPADLHDRLDNVEILVEDEREGDPGLYGLFDGVPLTERTPASMDMAGPDRVYVFRRPLMEDFGHDPALLMREVRITILHEIGHFFGLDEDRLAALGWA